ncbi:Lipoprotein-releasing system transmembrane protein LolC [Buchnera aphidicola (Tetraneura ulmi)]
MKNVIFFIVLRFFFKKRNFFFGHIINNISILGIVISVSGLIISSSIMNGLNSKITSNISNLSSHINISIKKNIYIKKKPFFFFSNNINKIIPIAEKKVIIYTNRNFDVGNLIIVNKENKFFFNNYKYSYYHSKFDNSTNRIFLNKNLAKSLNISLGETFYLFFPEFNELNNDFSYSKKNHFCFSGFFVSDNIFDQNQIILFYKNDEKILNMIKEMSQEWKIWLNNPLLVQKFKNKYNNINFLVTTWKEQEKELYFLIILEKNICNFLFFLVFLIGIINIFILMNLNIIEKEKDFSILLTLGIKKKDIFFIFFLQFLINCFLGLLFGNLFGILITKNINFFMQLMFTDIDLLTIKPIILISDISFFIKITIFFSFFSIFYPFFKMTKIKPIKVLSNE